ncbi:urea ABC transporter substrate-binding protein [Comamonas serinivorans]|uniref:Urea ABC transporter substrate-binding protein n=1 Tax=Comamonas serinivorans TaxID=1082851 RepID=A0A1Y0EJE3_9BURK|nr:urea ABC transporter substrate-binding protein [Comamonas serinivorans]ARU03580.1 urea ABC transporter substrate-binding protein [Comamonas serinivorans]
MTSISRRHAVKTLGIGTVAAPWVATGAWAQDVVKVGILHSLSGDMALSETSVVDAEKMAIDEINAAGGVLGRKVTPIVEDGASDWPIFAEKARKLVGRDKVPAVFGCMTSASRKAVLPVFEQLKGLLYYPTYYEGLEQSPNIFYTGAEASQQSIAACTWLMKHKGKTVYMVGSDYIWPRTTNKISRATIEKNGGRVLGEEYLPLGATNFTSIINKIKARRPDIILSTVVGGSNVAFFKQMLAAGIDKKKTTVLTLAMTEEEVSGVGAENAQGVLTCMSYFQSLDNPANKKFVAAFKAKYGAKRVVGDVMACGYNAVYLWKAGVEKAKSFDLDKVVAASAGLELDAPEGKVKVHGSNHHLWKHARIGEFGADGQVKLIFESPLIEPNPSATS